MSTPGARREFEFTLPIGFTDESGEVHRVGALRKMTGREEAILADRSIQRNGGQLVTSLLASCVVRLGSLEKVTPSVIGEMYSADRNYLLIRLRSATFGSELRASYSCPSCGETMPVLEDLDELPVRTLDDQDSPEDVVVELEDGYVDKDGAVHTALTLRLPRGSDETAVAPEMRKNASTGKNALLARCTRSLGDVPKHRLAALGPKILSDLTMTDRRIIDRALNSNAPGVDLIRDLTCTRCSGDFKASLDMTHFFSLE